MYSTLLEPAKGPTLYLFKIFSISTYRKEVDQLYNGMTGEIVLEAEHGEALLDTKLLVVLDSDAEVTTYNLQQE